MKGERMREIRTVTVIGAGTMGNSISSIFLNCHITVNLIGISKSMLEAAKNWSRPRRVVAKIEWDQGELFPRTGFAVTNSRLPAGKVIKVYKGRAEIENRIKEGKNTLRWGKTSYQGSRSTSPGYRGGFWLTTSCI